MLRSGGRRRRAAMQVLVAFVLFGAVDYAYFGAPVLAHLGRACACGNGSDPFDYMWFLAWWPHALLHGHNPFVTRALFAPGAVNLGAVDVVPGPAIVMAPVTLLFGPLVSYNVVALLAPVLAALFAFLLCRYLTGRFWPAVIGGYIYGFSPYLLGHLEGHLDLVLIFPVPAAVHLTLRHIDGRISRRGFVVAMALVLAFTFLSSQELAATLVLLGALALLIAYGLAPSARPRIARTLPPLLLAGAVAAVLVSVFIYYALTGELLNRFFNRYSDTLVADVLGFVIPTHVEAVGNGWFAGTASKFVGGTAENGVYVGLPLLLVTALWAITRWRDAAARLLLVLLAAVAVLMLGSHLHVAGNERFSIGSHHTIPLPWLALSRLPFLHEIAPARLGVYMFLLVAVIAALWLARPRAGWRRAAGWALAALGVAALVPDLGSGAWHSAPENPRLFTTDAYRRVLAPGEITLALPFAQDGDSMLWQAETGFRWRLAEGYVGALLPASYVRALPPAPVGADPVLPPDPNAIRAYIARRGIRAVVVADEQAPLWAPALAAAGLAGKPRDGAVIYAVRP